MSNYLKPQTPLYSKKYKAYIYPLTHSEQVIMPDGSRLTPDKLEAMILETATPDAIGALSMELLWENANPTSEFAAQTISLDLSGYTFVAVIFITSTAYPFDFTAKTRVGKSSYAYTESDTHNYVRLFHTSKTSVKFETGKLDNTDDNTKAVPVEIYGIKGVSA